MRTIGAHTRAVWLSYATLQKQLSKHQDVNLDDYLFIPNIVFMGRAIFDRPRSVTYLHEVVPPRMSWFKLSLRTTKRGHEIYVSTFHKISAKRGRRMLKNITP